MTVTVSRLRGVPAAARRACLLPALHMHDPAPLAETLTGLAPQAQRQLLQLLCEQAPAPTGQLLASFPDLLRDFFSASDAHIRGWFAHFSMAGEHPGRGGGAALCCVFSPKGCWALPPPPYFISPPLPTAHKVSVRDADDDATDASFASEAGVLVAVGARTGIGSFKYGAQALANYALARRETAWQLLVWTGKHSQARRTMLILCLCRLLCRKPRHRDGRRRRVCALCPPAHLCRVCSAACCGNRGGAVTAGAGRRGLEDALLL